MSIEKMLFIGTAHMRDVAFVGQRLRAEDRRELETAAPGRTAEDELMSAVTLSDDVWVASLGTEPIAVGGVGRGGVVWMVGTEGLSKATVSMFRTARSFVRGWLKKYPTLHNAADCRNVLHLRWLKLLGFTFDEVVGVYGQPFQRFHMTRKEDVPCAVQ